MVARSAAGAAAAAVAAALTVLALLLAGCRMPLFDEDLSLAVHTMSQLDHAYTIGPVEVCDLDPESQFLFIPGKFQNTSLTGKVIDDGMVVETRREETVYVHVTEAPGEDYYVIEENANNPLWRFYPRPPGDPGDVFSRYVETVVETSGSGNIYILGVYPDRRFSGDSIFTDQYEAATADFNTGGTYPFAYDTGGWFGANEAYIGAGVYPAPTAADDLFLMLTYDDTAGEFYEYAEPVSQDGLVNIPAQFNTVPIGSVEPPETVFYYHHPPSGRSYMSYAAGSSFKNWVFDAPAGATEFTPLDVSGRIARVLSTGELLVRRKRTMSLYGPTGEGRGSFPVGDLRLAFEYYNGDKSRHETVFTYIYFENRETGDCDTTAYARVYTIPTSKLHTLD
ncbi:MAG: hypothetical protein GVY14_13450 [Spirochaetes bacterium]|jgi:hypothetical protein|nr:hypothetical protein [Spirochaetota bacterium]